MKLNHGDTIWHEAQQNLSSHGNAQPSQQQILAESQRILDLNHMNWEAARHLADGTEIKL